MPAPVRGTVNQSTFYGALRGTLLREDVQWHAANGASAGWQQWSIDLGGYAGRQVEVSITVLSDWGLQQFPGVFVDDIEVSTGEGTTSFEDDGDPMDGWTIPGAPQDDAGVEGENLNDWVRRGGFAINEGAAITTPASVYLGFGFEGHHRQRHAQRGDGPDHRLPPALRRDAGFDRSARAEAR